MVRLRRQAAARRRPRRRDRRGSAREGIACAPYLPSIHLQSYMRERFGFAEGLLPGERGLRARARWRSRSTRGSSARTRSASSRRSAAALTRSTAGGDNPPVADGAPRMIFLGFGKYVRADKIYALEPLGAGRARARRTHARVGRGDRRADRRLAHRAGDRRRDGRRTRPPRARDRRRGARPRPAGRGAAEQGRFDVVDLGRRARRLLESTAGSRRRRASSERGPRRAALGSAFFARSVHEVAPELDRRRAARRRRRRDDRRGRGVRPRRSGGHGFRGRTRAQRVDVRPAGPRLRLPLVRHPLVPELRLRGRGRRERRAHPCARAARRARRRCASGAGSTTPRLLCSGPGPALPGARDHARARRPSARPSRRSSCAPRRTGRDRHRAADRHHEGGRAAVALRLAALASAGLRPLDREHDPHPGQRRRRTSSVRHASGMPPSVPSFIARARSPAHGIPTSRGRPVPLADERTCRSESVPRGSTTTPALAGHAGVDDSSSGWPWPPCAGERAAHVGHLDLVRLAVATRRSRSPVKNCDDVASRQLPLSRSSRPRRGRPRSAATAYGTAAAGTSSRRSVMPVRQRLLHERLPDQRRVRAAGDRRGRGTR